MESSKEDVLDVVRQLLGITPNGSAEQHVQVDLHPVTASLLKSLDLPEVKPCHASDPLSLSSHRLQTGCHLVWGRGTAAAPPAQHARIRTDKTSGMSARSGTACVV